ncbi:MAG: hypothetical protein JRN39_07765 [Nitrososphaerota archaeon]|nr:hypothetical protein [Nitrososphaerota archaeon]
MVRLSRVTLVSLLALGLLLASLLFTTQYAWHASNYVYPSVVYSMQGHGLPLQYLNRELSFCPPAPAECIPSYVYLLSLPNLIVDMAFWVVVAYVAATLAAKRRRAQVEMR